MCFQGCYLVMCSVFTFMLEVLNMCMFSFPIKSQESTRSMCSDQPMQPSVPRLNYSWVWQRDMVLTDLAPLGQCLYWGEESYRRGIVNKQRYSKVRLAITMLDAPLRYIAAESESLLIDIFSVWYNFGSITHYKNQFNMNCPFEFQTRKVPDRIPILNLGHVLQFLRYIY